MPTIASLLAHIVYPESEGKPLADDSKQAEWMVLLFTNLELLFHDRADVFVALDLVWYPVEGEPDRRTAPDVFVVFGRSKGHRGCYKQWEESKVSPAVVFDFVSPGTKAMEMERKFVFYEDHGVEESYVYSPDTNRLEVFIRCGDVLERVRPTHDFVSPRLNIRFDLSSPEMVLRHPDGQPFLTLQGERLIREQTEQRAAQAEQLAARLAELGRKARRGQVTPEELQELNRLEERFPSPLV
jgi:Uma2 family endonuclease